MTYRSRGRSLIEVILVRRCKPRPAVDVLSTTTHQQESCVLMCYLSFLTLFANSNSRVRQCVLWYSWWGSLQFYASATISGQSEHKNDNGNDGWRNWRRQTMQRRRKGCTRRMPTIPHPTKLQPTWPAAPGGSTHSAQLDGPHPRDLAVYY